MTRPILNRTPVKIPLIADGKTTLKIVCDLVAPKDNDASLKP